MAFLVSKRRKQLLSALIQILVVIAVYAGIQLYQKRNALQGLAPRINGVLLDGDKIDTKSLSGRPYVVHFWATWCSICRIERSSIAAISKDYPVLGIASQSGDADAILNEIKLDEIGYPSLVDDSGMISRQFNVKAFPTTYIVDAKGKIRFVEIGFTTELGLRARLAYLQNKTSS